MAVGMERVRMPTKMACGKACLGFDNGVGFGGEKILECRIAKLFKLSCFYPISFENKSSFGSFSCFCVCLFCDV